MVKTKGLSVPSPFLWLQITPNSPIIRFNPVSKRYHICNPEKVPLPITTPSDPTESVKIRLYQRWVHQLDRLAVAVKLTCCSHTIIKLEKAFGRVEVQSSSGRHRNKNQRPVLRRFIARRQAGRMSALPTVRSSKRYQELVNATLAQRRSTTAAVLDA